MFLSIIITHIYDIHMKFEASLHICKISPTVRAGPPKQLKPMKSNDDLMIDMGYNDSNNVFINHYNPYLWQTHQVWGFFTFLADLAYCAAFQCYAAPPCRLIPFFKATLLSSKGPSINNVGCVFYYLRNAANMDESGKIWMSHTNKFWFLITL